MQTTVVSIQRVVVPSRIFKEGGKGEIGGFLFLDLSNHTIPKEKHLNPHLSFIFGFMSDLLFLSARAWSWQLIHQYF